MTPSSQDFTQSDATGPRAELQRGIASHLRMRHFACMQALCALALSAFWPSGSASAGPGAPDQTQIMGNNLARQCFEAVTFGSPLPEALDICTKTLDNGALTPEDRSATLVNRGIIFVRHQEPELALADFDAALKLIPDQADVEINRAVAFFGLNQIKDALAALDHAIALGPNDMHAALIDRGMALEKLGDMSGALRDYRHALAQRPRSKAAREGLKRLAHTRAPGSPADDHAASDRSADHAPIIDFLPDPNARTVPATREPAASDRKTVRKKRAKSKEIGASAPPALPR